MWLLRTYLLLGLLTHKAIWEILKRGRPAASKVARPFRLELVKLVKIAILLGILVQTVLPFDVLPLSENSSAIRSMGVVLFTIGLLLAVLGRLQLGSNWSDIEMPEVGSKQLVVSRGLYGYIRHPIYVGDLILLVGLELALNSWLVLGAVLLVPVVLRRAIAEEKLLATTLEGYDAYAQRTKRFIPFVV